MIQRALFSVIRSGIEYLRDNPGTVTDFFTRGGLMEDGEPEKIEKLFMDQIAARLASNKKPPVIHGYAQALNILPVWAITLGVRDETQQFLSDEGEPIDEDTDADGSDSFGAIFTDTFNILSYSQNADLTLYMHELLEQFIINAIPVLRAEPIIYSNIRLNAADIQPNLDWVPEGAYVRRLTVSGMRQCNQLWPGSNLGRVHKVKGVHISATGAPGQSVGNVQTHVTTSED